MLCLPESCVMLLLIAAHGNMLEMSFHNFLENICEPAPDQLPIHGLQNHASVRSDFLPVFPEPSESIPVAKWRGPAAGIACKDDIRQTGLRARKQKRTNCLAAVSLQCTMDGRRFPLCGHLYRRSHRRCYHFAKMPVPFLFDLAAGS